MKTSIVIAVLMLVAVTVGLAADMSADQIVEKANQAAYYAGADGRAEVKMEIQEAGGMTRVREMVILRMNVDKGDTGNQKFYVYFKEPADVRGMAYLVWKQIGAGEDDDRWMWLPKLNNKRRIAPGDKRTSFVGSDFLYEDVSGRNIHADTHELVDTDDKYYKLKSMPKKADAVEFAHFFTWVDKTTFLPMKAEYIDKNGKLYRRVEALEVKEIQGYPTVMKAAAHDLNDGSSTINTFEHVKYDNGFKEAIFSERFLRRPPREVR